MPASASVPAPLQDDRAGPRARPSDWHVLARFPCRVEATAGGGAVGRRLEAGDQWRNRGSTETARGFWLARSRWRGAIARGPRSSTTSGACGGCARLSRGGPSGKGAGHPRGAVRTSGGRPLQFSQPEGTDAPLSWRSRAVQKRFTAWWGARAWFRPSMASGS